MRQHLDIADVERATKIRAKYLRALENEEFGLLPGPRSSRRSCAPTRRRSGLDPQRPLEEYRATTRRARRPENLQPLGPPAVARERRRASARRAGPWLAIGLAVVAVVARLLVIGLIGGDDDGGGRAAAPRRGDHDGQPAARRRRSRSPPPPRSVWLRDRPSEPDLRLRRQRRGHGGHLRGDHAREPQTFRGRRLRSTSARPTCELTRERQDGADRAGPRPGRLRVHAGPPSRSRSASAPAPMSARAGIVVTGTEVLTGRVRDRNGPWLSDRLLELGIELAHITICGDRPEDMDGSAALHGRPGRGPGDHERRAGPDGGRHDDRGRRPPSPAARWSLDEDLEERIAEILRPLMKRFRHLDFDAVRAANRKQALVPEGAHVIYPAGTAPGLVVPGKPDDRGPAGPAARAARDVAAGGRDARRSRRRRRTHRATSSRRCACSASRSRRSPRRCGWPRARSRASTRLEITTCLRRARGRGGHALRAAGAGGLGRAARPDRRAPRALALLDRRLDVDDQVAELLAGAGSPSPSRAPAA